MVSNMPQRQRVLIVSPSNTGTEVIHALSEEKASRRPIVFALCEDTTELDQATKERCNRVVQGDYKSEHDLERAMRKSKADTVIFAPEDKSPSASSFSTMGQTALESVLQRSEFCHVRLFFLSKHGSAALSEPEQQPKDEARQLATISSPTVSRHKRKSTPPLLKDALEGLSGFWSAVQSLTCSNAGQMLMDASEKTTDSTHTSSTFATPWKTRRSNVSPAIISTSLIDCDDECRDPPALLPSFDSDMSQISNPLHLRVSRKDFVQFVVGAVLERGSSSSFGSDGVARGILVTAE